jgi:AcrR family transcriptional regulator
MQSGNLIILRVYSNMSACQGPMKSRPYRLGQRQTTVERTHARILAAARKLLGASRGFSGFTIDAVAARAGVARMTVFNQFGSKRGLLEALFDDLAARGLLERLFASLAQPEPRAALDEMVAAFAGFWSSDRIVLRRIRGLAAIDPDFEVTVRARDERRRDGLRTIVGRLADKYHKPAPAARDEVIAILHTLTSFETFDNLAGPRRKPDDVVSLVCQLAQAAVTLDENQLPVDRSSHRR